MGQMMISFLLENSTKFNIFIEFHVATDVNGSESDQTDTIIKVNTTKEVKNISALDI